MSSKSRPPTWQGSGSRRTPVSSSSARRGPCPSLVRGCSETAARVRVRGAGREGALRRRVCGQTQTAFHFSGPAYDLTFCEVRDTSLVLLWKAPVYSGSSPISGYFVDYKEEDSGEWSTVNEAATANRYLKVTPSLHVVAGVREGGWGPAGALSCQASRSDGSVPRSTVALLCSCTSGLGFYPNNS